MTGLAASLVYRAGATRLTAFAVAAAALVFVAGCANPPVADLAASVKANPLTTNRAACFQPTCCDDAVALQFTPHRLNCRAIALIEQGQRAESFKMLRAAINAAKAETVRKQDATEVLCFALNDAAHHADIDGNDALSRTLFDGNLAACKSRFGDSSDTAAFALWSGASQHINHDRLDVATPQIERVIALSRSNGNRGLESFATDALGRIKDMQGNRVEARRLLQQAITLKAAVFGARSREVATSYSNMGASFIDGNEGATGRDWYRRAIAIYAEVLGPADEQTLRTSAGLASSHLADGELAEAIRLFDALLPKFRQAFGATDNRTVVLLNDWGAALARLEKYADALAKFEQSLAIRRSTIPNSVRHGNSALNAAKMKKMISSCTAAEPLRQEARAVASANMTQGNQSDPDVVQFVAAVTAFEQECAPRRSAAPVPRKKP